MPLPYKSSAAVAYVVSVTHFGNALELHDDLINLSFYDLFYSLFIQQCDIVFFCFNDDDDYDDDDVVLSLEAVTANR